MATLIQRSLASGEISPALQKRVDLAKYLNGLRTLRNCIVKKGGGATNRGGSTLVYGPLGAGLEAAEPSVWDDFTSPRATIDEGTRLRKWVSPSSADSFVLEFGDGHLRFTKNGDLVTVGDTEDWSAAEPYVVGDIATREGIHYYCVFPHTNQEPTVAVDYGAYWYTLSGYIYEIPTPWYSANGDFVADCCFSQDSDFLLITHPTILPHILKRLDTASDTSWALFEWVTKTAGSLRYGMPRIAAPTSLGHSGGTGSNQSWAVTAITEDLEESLAAEVTGAGAATGNSVTLSWTASVFDPQNQARPAETGVIKGYRVYKKYQGVYFYLAFVPAGSTSYVDDASVVPDVDGDSPPESRGELVHAMTGDYPAKCGAFQQRTLLGRFPFNVQAVYAGRVGYPENFTRSFPSADDDSILFQLKGQEISGVRHFADIGDLVVLADSGEWIVRGSGADGALTPSPKPVPKQYGANGASSDVPPVVVGSRCVYVQERGSIVRSLGFDAVAGGREGFIDEDLTAFAEHLFEGRTIVSMDFQKTPHSAIWCVFDDGEMVSITYIKEQEILACARHDTDGEFEQVCCVPEGNEHAVYYIVKREIDGAEVRYLERMADRTYTDANDAIFCDSALSYDGRNADTTKKLTISGGTDWDEDEELTLEADFDAFSELEIGNEYWLTGSDGIVYRLEVTAYTDVRHVTVRPQNTIPTTAILRNTATSSWARAIDTIRNLNHLEGKEVVVQADGDEIANPNVAAYEDAITVTDGEIELEECHATYHVGLPYISDIETLAIDTMDGRLVGQQKLVTAVILDVQKTRGVYAGPKAPSNDDVNPLENLFPLKYGAPGSDEMETAREEFTGEVEVNIAGEWNGNGRVFIRQVSAKPMTVLSIAPAGLFPGGG